MDQEREAGIGRESIQCLAFYINSSINVASWGREESLRSTEKSWLIFFSRRLIVLFLLFQAWPTLRCFTRWSTATGCSVPRDVRRRSTRSCWSAGTRTPWSGRRSRPCSGSWRTSLRCQILNIGMPRPIRFFVSSFFVERALVLWQGLD